MKAVIFAGGVGTRLWPLSRKNSPKQFEKIQNNHSMLQLAVNRLHPDFSNDDIYIATGVKYHEIVKEQLAEIPEQNILMEPEMRDVGPAVGLLAALFSKRSPDEPIAIIWGDHLVKEDEMFRDVLKRASDVLLEDKNKIIFISQKPRFANQNLGWIEYGKPLKSVDSTKLFEFKALKYRPELDVAIKFFMDGHHAWNLGYFVTTPAFLWSLFEKFAPAEMYQKLQQIKNSVDTPDFNKVLSEVYPTIEKISFDDAVLEKLDASLAYVISENLGWSDVGAWDAFKEAFEMFPSDNVTLGKVETRDCEDSLIYNYEDKKLIVAIDADSMIIVNTPDVLLITQKTSVPKIKKLVESFAKTKYEEFT